MGLSWTLLDLKDLYFRCPFQKPNKYFTWMEKNLGTAEDRNQDHCFSVPVNQLLYCHGSI